MPKRGKVDPLLYDYSPKFGAAGGPDELRLTDFGHQRTFKVATGISLSYAELDLITAIDAAGDAGLVPSGRVISFLSANGLTRNDKGRDFISEKGRLCLAKAYAEDEALLDRIREEADRSATEAGYDKLAKGRVG
jgi:hypothetical protein